MWSWRCFDGIGRRMLRSIAQRQHFSATSIHHRQHPQWRRFISSSSCLATNNSGKHPRTTASDSDEAVEAATWSWFHNIVVGQKLCPFASPLIKDKQLRVVTSQAITTDQAVAHVTREARFLMKLDTSADSEKATNSVDDEQEHDLHPETTLVVFGQQEATWAGDFREFVRLSWELQDLVIQQHGLTALLQLVLFHPHATHQTYGDDPTAASDFTIRSPYPTVHLLREADVMRAVESGYPNLEELPTRNKGRMMEQGVEACQQRLNDCYTMGEPRSV